MPYHAYKILHLASILLVTSLLGISFFSVTEHKWGRILSGILSLLIFISGFGLLAKLGFTGPGTWPLWANLKIGIWIIIAAGGPLMAKRLTRPRHRALAYGFLMTLFITAIIFGVLRV